MFSMLIKKAALQVVRLLAEHAHLAPTRLPLYLAG
jgi:hypothetical protein